MVLSPKSESVTQIKSLSKGRGVKHLARGPDLAHRAMWSSLLILNWPCWSQHIQPVLPRAICSVHPVLVPCARYSMPMPAPRLTVYMTQRLSTGFAWHVVHGLDPVLHTAQEVGPGCGLKVEPCKLALRASSGALVKGNKEYIYVAAWAWPPVPPL